MHLLINNSHGIYLGINLFTLGFHCWQDQNSFSSNVRIYNPEYPNLAILTDNFRRFSTYLEDTNMGKDGFWCKWSFTRQMDCEMAEENCILWHISNNTYALNFVFHIFHIVFTQSRSGRRRGENTSIFRLPIEK